jgi:hypothetical protein
MSLSSAGSISLDSTFNTQNLFWISQNTSHFARKGSLRLATWLLFIFLSFSYSLFFWLNLDLLLNPTEK